MILCNYVKITEFAIITVLVIFCFILLITLFKFSFCFP